MRAPRRKAFLMRVAEIARPPRNFGAAAREIHHVLPGAASGFEHIAGFAVEEFFEHRPDRLVIAVKCRRIETAIRLDRPAILAEFNDIFSHSPHPLFAIPGCAFLGAAPESITPNRGYGFRARSLRSRPGMTGQGLSALNCDCSSSRY